MRMIIIGTCVLLFSGCGVIPKKPEIPEQELLVDEQVHSMSRLEVMNAINECQSARTRAVVVYGKRKVGGVTRDIVVDVTCAPLY
jgi:starvation-inducible outer membrane lipoprotein